MSQEQSKVEKSKRRLNIIFISSMMLLELILMFVLFYVITSISSGEQGFFNSLALCIIIIWIAVLIGYLAWAVYFYNINLGLTNQDWTEIRKKKEQGFYVDEPSSNPNAEHTLGLPPGTVRGIMALSLLFGAMAMMVAALGGDPNVDQNSFFTENFEFFRTAFLMMIAFYFGEKSLKHFQKDNKSDVETTTEAEIDPEGINLQGMREDLYNEAQDDSENNSEESKTE